MTTIPASEIVNVTPSVLAAGGTAKDLNGLVMTTTQRVPIGTVSTFNSASAVSSYFGGSSNEAAIAAVYFQAYDTSVTKPGSLLFAQYNTSDVLAFLRGASVASLTLAQIQALSGTISVTINGAVVTGTVSLAAATSNANAAAIISNGLNILGPVDATTTAVQGATFNGSGSGTSLTVTQITNGGILSVGDTLSGSGVPGGTTIVTQLSGTTNLTGVYQTSLATTSGSTSILTARSTVMNVSVVATGTVTIGDQAVGTGVSLGTFYTGQLTGGTVGGVGQYRTNISQFFLSQSVNSDVPGVFYDTVTNAFQINSSTRGSASTIGFASGTLSTTLNLTQVTGAVLSQGSGAIVSPATFLNGVIQVTQNWGSFMFGFNLDGTTTLNTNKLAAAAWNSTQDSQYVFVCQDTDASPTVSVPATSSLGYLISQANYGGVCLIYEPTNLYHAAFICGSIAAIDFSAANGRTTFAFRSQTGLVPGVTSQTIADNLRANNYNYYGAYATAAENFVFFYPGSVSGPFTWLDSYIDQIWLNSNFQVDLMTLLTQVGSIPYNADGNTLIESALGDTIAAAGNFGVFRPGVQLSSLQVTEVNNAAAGRNIAPTLQNRGWYLLVQAASPAVRQARGSPPCTFWYVDGQSVQSINLSSVELE